MKQQLTSTFILLGGAIAWTLHLFITYTIGEFSCVAAGTVFSFLGLTAAAWGLIAVTIACLAISVLALWPAWGWMKGGAKGNRLFVARTGLITNAVFIVTIVAQALPPFFLMRGC